MKFDPEALELVVYRCLEEGVPANVVARIFSLDVEVVRDCLKLVRAHRYGADDLVDYTAQLQWDALEEASQIMAHGSPAEKGRFAAAVLRTTLALQGRRTPEKLAETQDELRRLFAGMRSGGSKSSGGPDARFLAYADGEGDEDEEE
jgi:hypothetical protein